MTKEKQKLLKNQSYFFIAILIFLFFLSYQTLKPMIYDIALAVIFTVLLSPLYEYLKKKLKMTSIVASSTCLIFFIVCISIPSFLLIRSLYGELVSINFNELWKNIQYILTTNIYLKKIFYFFPNIEQSINETDFNKYITPFLNFLTNKSASFLQQTTSLIINFVIVLYILFYLLIDGNKLKNIIMNLSPLEKNHEKELVEKMSSIIRAILFGSIFIAIIEGLFGMILFSTLNIKAPIFWGFVMMIFSLIPILGTNTILLPVAIYSLLIGDYTAFFILLIIGCGGILISQNIIKVKIVENKSNIPVPFIVLSTLGGIIWLGPIGFILGPIIVGIFLVFINQYSIRFKEELNFLNKNKE